MAPTLIVLRYGDPVVDAIRAAGPGPLVVLRVLPPQLGSSQVEQREGLELLQPSVRAQLAGLVAGRRPVPRLVVRFGEPIEAASGVVAAVPPGRIVCARDMAHRLAAIVAAPMVAAEDARPMRRHGPAGSAVAFLRRALQHHVDVKVSALRALRRSIRGREVGQSRGPSLVGGPSILYGTPAIATVTALEPVKALVAGTAQFRAIAAIDAVTLRLKAASADRLGDYLGTSTGGCAFARG